MSTKDGAFENSVIAALDTCANRRACRAGSEGASTFPDAIGRTVAIIEAAPDKLDAGTSAQSKRRLRARRSPST